MTDDLVKRLRDHAGDLRYHEWDEENEAAQKCAEAADRIEALTAENERLRAALGVAKMWSDKDWVGYEIVCKALTGATE